MRKKPGQRNFYSWQFPLEWTWNKQFDQESSEAILHKADLTRCWGCWKLQSSGNFIDSFNGFPEMTYPNMRSALTCSQLWCACNQEISLRRCRTSPDETGQVRACRYSRLLAWKTRNAEKFKQVSQNHRKGQQKQSLKHSIQGGELVLPHPRVYA